MGKKEIVDIYDYDWERIHGLGEFEGEPHFNEYPNIGYDNEGDLIKLSFKGNSNIRPHNVNFLLSDIAKEEKIKCKNDMFYFFENYCYIQTQKAKIKVVLRDYQREFLELIRDENRIIGMLSRQIGKTTVCALYVVWCMCFDEDWTGLVVANEKDLKYEIVEMIQGIYESLPPFLQRGVKKWNMGGFQLEWNTKGIKRTNKLRSAVAGKNAGRGKTPSFVLCDESAWYDETKSKAFFDSIKASLSSGDEGKFVMISTPNGFNIFHTYWQNAKKGESNFKYFFANWRAVPGRDEKWKQNIIKEDDLTTEEWLQNHECAFLGSSATLLKPKELEKLSPIDGINNVIVDDDVLYKESNPNSVYIMGIDSSKTVGKDNANNDYICIKVLKLGEKIEEVYTYRTNNIHYKEVSKIAYDIGEYYNFPLCVVENNEGSGTWIANDLLDIKEYPNMYFDPKKDGLEVGIRTTSANRPIGLTTIRKLIEKNIMLIKHDVTINEFYSFIKVGKRYEASNGETDDCIMSLCVCMYVLLDINNEMEITLDDYLEGLMKEEDEEDTTSIGFYATSNNDNLENDGGVIWNRI